MSALPNPGVFYEKWDTGIFEITGKDRIKLLHNIASQDFEHLNLGSGTRSCLLTNTGRIVSIGNYLNGQDRLWVEIPKDLHTSTAAHLDKYIIMEDVQVGPMIEKWKVYEVLGRDAISKLSSLFSELPELDQNFKFKIIERHGTPVLLWRHDHFNAQGICLALEYAVAQKLPHELSNLGFVQISPEMVQAFEVYYGEPRLGADYTLENLPLEVGEKSSISFTKGCYLGQEIIARIESRGHIAKGLAQIKWEQAIPVQPGQEIYTAEDKSLIGIATRSIADEKNTYSLGFLKYEFLKSGNKIVTSANGQMIPGEVLKVL